MRLLASFFIFFTSFIIYSQTITYKYNVNWSEQTPSPNTRLNCISALKSISIQQIVFTCGENSTVFMTTNGGINWIFRGANGGTNGLPPGINLTVISCLTNNTILTSGNIGSISYVYRSDDNGLNWMPVFTEASGKINSILFENPDITFLIGNPVNGRWSIWKSLNYGITWDSTGLFLPQSGTETGFENSAYSDYGYNGQVSFWFGTNNNRIYYSVNTGLEWNARTVPEQNINSLAAIGRNVTCGGTALFSSTDYGSVWNSEISLGTGIINGLIIPNVPLIGISTDNLFTSTPILYIRSDNKIYYTDNGGGTGWKISYTASEGNFTHLNSSFSRVWAVRDNGAITKGEIDIITSITPNSYPYTFELKQNYPNPFNPKTKIPIVIYSNTNISLKIYNSSGKLVATLLEGNSSQFPVYDIIIGVPRYEVEWDASDFPSGVYYYRVVSDDFKETRKMILLK